MPPARRVCPKRLAKATVKKRPLDFKGAISVAKKNKLNIETTKVAEDADSSREPVELDERTTQILEEELQAIMIKVWQALPDAPPSAAERFVTEQLRNEASDDIRNILGLNVTKRLLNVYNPLFVKIQFPAKPDPDDFKEFIDKNNITEVRTKYHHRQHRFFVRVASIADFDRLCTDKDLRCGNMKATEQKPNYRFSDLPMKLKTGFIKKMKIPSKSQQGEKEVEDKKTTENSSTPTNSENKQPTVQSKQISKNDQPPKTNIEKKNESDSKVTAQSNINKVNVTKKVESNQEIEQNIKNIEVSKQNSVTPNKISELKSNVLKGTQNIEKTPTDAPKLKPSQVTQEARAVKKVDVEKTSSTSVSKPVMNQDNQKVEATKKVTEATPKTTAKTNLTKPKPNQVSKESVATKKITESTPKSVEKTTVTIDQPVATKKLEQTPKAVKNAVKPNVINPKQNQVNKEVVSTKKVTKPKPKVSIKNVEMVNSETFDQEDEINEDEEMDDEEILALISTGIVVDECSGSDVE